MNPTSPFDWLTIQSFYNEGHSSADTARHFGISVSSITRSYARGEFKYRSKIEARRLSTINHPQKHSEAAKKKISERRIAYLTKNPDKVPYLLNHYSKGASYPEKYFEKAFREAGLDLKMQQQVGLYSLDFCDPLRRIDIEIDGNQHYCDMRIVESDKRRTKFLEEQGWMVVRIRWSDYMKMSLGDRRILLQQIVETCRSDVDTALPKFHCPAGLNTYASNGVRVFNRKCQQCGIEFEAQYRHTKFCSDPCRRVGRNKRERHATRRNKRRYGKIILYVCKSCGSNFESCDKDRKYCSPKCSTMSHRKVARPTTEELQSAIATSPCSSICKQYGVSDKTIAKWCKAYGIDRTQYGRGYWAKQAAHPTAAL